MRRPPSDDYGFEERAAFVASWLCMSCGRQGVFAEGAAQALIPCDICGFAIYRQCVF